jgi:glutathione synthase/RimK-type ligase-like ATP-grasp enzyme
MGEHLGYKVRRLFTDRPNPTFVPREWHKIINWGNSSWLSNNLDVREPIVVVNKAQAVCNASNKLSTFNLLKGKDGIRIPEFTVDHNVAKQWINSGHTVVCRTKLSGHSGDGIVLAGKVEDVVPAPLYVQYVKKQKEFRVHVAFGEVIDVQEKRKRNDYEGEANFQVRNHHTGWVYCREDITEPTGLREMAIRAVQELGLDFGACDLLYNAKRNWCYCLEVNTAPGLEGTTVDKYAQAFVEKLK